MVPEIVIDASVAVKWFTERSESNVLEARSILETVAKRLTRAWVPSIFFYELGNLFVRDAARTREEIEEHFLFLSELQFEQVQSDAAYSLRIAVTAREHRLTFYDAAYLAVAQERNISLITEDRELLATKLPFVFSLTRFVHQS